MTRELKATQENLKYNYKTKLVQDIHMRWNSTYDMCDSISTNEHALKAMKQDTLVNKAIIKYVPNKDEF